MNTVKFYQVRTRRSGVLFFAKLNINGLKFDCDAGIASTMAERTGKIQPQTVKELREQFTARGLDPDLVESLSIVSQ